MPPVACILALLTVLGVGACDGADPSGLVVDLRTSFAPGTDFDQVRTEVQPRDPTLRADFRDRPVAESDAAPEGIRVAEFGGVSGPYTVTARLLSAGAQVASMRVLVDVRGRTAVTLVVDRACACDPLGGGDCVGVACPDGGDDARCTQRCESASDCATSGCTCCDSVCLCPTPSGDAGVPDAAVDAGCEPGLCDDGVACTVDRCDGDACVHEPDDGACGAGEVCDRTSGCSCPGSPCRALAPQCGCEDGQGCYHDDGTGESACMAAGRRLEGERCTALNDCAPPMSCKSGTCRLPCDDDPDVCIGAGSHCSRRLPAAPLGFCTIDCDPVAQDCLEGACVLVAGGSGPPPHTDCAPRNGGAASCGSCLATGDCATGLLCARYGPLGDTIKCRPYCEVGGAPCPDGDTCLPAGREVDFTVGDVRYGFCDGC